jgi:hypothetical protein
MEKIKTPLAVRKQTDVDAVQGARRRVVKKYRLSKKLNLVLTATQEQREMLYAGKEHQEQHLTSNIQHDQLHIDEECADFNVFNEHTASPPRMQKIYADKIDSSCDDRTDKLFSDSNVTVHDFMMSFLALKFKHKLDTSTCDDILALIHIILPTPNSCPSNSITFENKLDDSLKSSGTIYNTCNTDTCRNVAVTADDLQRKVCTKCNQTMDQFFTCSVQKQIVEILSKQNLMEQIIDSNKRARVDHAQLYDVIDGAVYKEAIKLIPNDKMCVSLIINTDGAPVASSTNYSLWPMLATIVELTPASRGAFKNMLFLGFWLGTNKPNYQLYTGSCLKELKESKNTSFTVKSMIFIIQSFTLFSSNLIKLIILNLRLRNRDPNSNLLR